MIPLLGALTPIIEKALSFIPDPAKKAEAQLKLQQEINDHSEAILASLTAVDVAQANVNLEQAKSSDKFVSRARPAIMWICAFGLGWEAVLLPFLGTILVFANRAAMVAQLPHVNNEILMPMLGYMLGYGGMRTWEKSKGVTK